LSFISRLLVAIFNKAKHSTIQGQDQAALLRRQGFAFGSELQPFEHGAFQRQLLQQGILVLQLPHQTRGQSAQLWLAEGVDVWGLMQHDCQCGRAHSFGQLGAFRIDFCAMFLNDLITPRG
jgi:hypothetical protein